MGEGQIELWQWRYTDDFGKRRVFPCRLTEEQARHYKDAKRVEGSLDVRKALGSTSDFQHTPSVADG